MINLMKNNKKRIVEAIMQIKNCEFAYLTHKSDKLVLDNEIRAYAQLYLTTIAIIDCKMVEEKNNGRQKQNLLNYRNRYLSELVNIFDIRGLDLGIDDVLKTIPAYENFNKIRKNTTCNEEGNIVNYTDRECLLISELTNIYNHAYATASVNLKLSDDILNLYIRNIETYLQGDLSHIKRKVKHL